MRKLCSLLLVLILLSACVKTNYNNGELNIFMPGEYISDEVVEQFEYEYGVKVKITLFDTNESMYTKLLTNTSSYDIILPSDYMIERLINEDMLQKLDKSKLPCLQYLYDGVKNMDYDPNNDYSVPYFWGNGGIVYDSTIVDSKDVETEGWAVLKNTKYKGQIYMYDSIRDIFMVAFKDLGYSMGTNDPKEINDAYNWLVDVAKTMAPAYATDECIDGLAYGEKAMGFMYSGDAADVMKENPDMGFYMPEEGTNYWFDGFVISKDCKNTDMANKFINYMISDKNAFLNTQEVGYLTTNTVAAAKARKKEFKNNNAYSMRVGPKDECFNYQDTKTKEMFSNYWTKVKAK